MFDNTLGCGARVLSAVHKLWTLLSCIIAVTLFGVVLSLNLDPKNPKVIFFESTCMNTSLTSLQVSRTAAIAILMAVLWVMTPIPGDTFHYFVTAVDSASIQAIHDAVPATALVPLALLPLLGVVDGASVAR
jgi:hypothetical protein